MTQTEKLLDRLLGPELRHHLQAHGVVTALQAVDAVRRMIRQAEEDQSGSPDQPKTEDATTADSQRSADPKGEGAIKSLQKVQELRDAEARLIRWCRQEGIPAPIALGRSPTGERLAPAPPPGVLFDPREPEGTHPRKRQQAFSADEDGASSTDDGQED